MTARKIDRRSLLISAAATAICGACVGSTDEEASDDCEGLTFDSPASQVIQCQEDARIEAAGFTAGQFGLPINVGKPAAVLQAIRDNGGFWYRADGRMWLAEFPAEALDQARSIYSAAELAGMEAGIVALHQKCPHLGCRVQSCASSQWFECPCHGSKYNQVGEQRNGPAPRGMDRFATEITNDGDLVVLTGEIIEGPPIGTDTTGQQADGPFCVAVHDE